MIIVTGADGQLGGDVCALLTERKIPFIGIGKKQLDITDKASVKAFFESNKADTLIHCAAYTAVDKAEDDEESCMAVNFDGTKNLAECCKDKDIKMLYISTDYVFKGDGAEPFEVDNEKGPLNVYGKSKLMGEQAVLENCKKYFIVRTSWVFGEKNTNFIHTMLRLSQIHDSVRVVCDQTGSPTYSKHLAKAVCDIAVTEKYGIYHATNEGFCSWNELASEAFRVAKRPTEVIPVTTQDFGSRAARPHNSRLSKKSLDEAGFDRLPDWKDAVKEYIDGLMSSVQGN